MIKFTRDGNKVTVWIKDKIIYADNSSFHLDLHQSHNYQAELLCKHLQEGLRNELEKIQQEFYNIGWKDAKAKKRKQTSFWGQWQD